MSPKKQSKPNPKGNRAKLFPDVTFNYSKATERPCKADIVSFTPEEIVINKNNCLANIPADHVKVKNTLMMPMLGFLNNHPIHGPLLADPKDIYFTYLCEFWYTARIANEDDEVNAPIISAYLKGSPYTITLEIFRNAIGGAYLEEGESFIPVPSDKDLNYRSILLNTNYPREKLFDNDKMVDTGTPKLTDFKGTWKLFFKTLVECLTGKSGGLDQVTHNIMKMAFCICQNLKFDYAALI